MAFFCAGSSNVANRKNKPQKAAGSRPTQAPKVVSGDNDRLVNGSLRNPPLSTTIPHSDSVDLPHSRKMIVTREYIPQDNRGLAVRGGESVQVIRQESNFALVRNEWGKEGIVPSTHLFAPYTATRTRKPVASNPIRPVASGSSVHDFDPAPRNVPMYPSHSAGRPRHYTMEDNDNKMMNGTRRVTSPNTSVAPLIARNDLSYNNNNVTMTTTGGPSYEQKYSPSSSSGVATGPSSPSFTSLHHSTSQENLGQDTSSSSQSPNDQLSLSSIEEEDKQPYPAVIHPMHYFEDDTERRGGPLSSDETLTRIGGRATSESNLFSLKQRPLPPPPSRRNKEGVYVSKHTNHIYSTITDDTPPPIPPRNVPTTYSTSQGDGSTDTYSNPIDAISQGGSSHHSQDRMPHYRVRSLTDVRTREVKHSAQYSPVFHGTVSRSHGKSNGSSHYDPESVTSDGGSSRRSSKKSVPRDRIQEEAGFEGPQEKMPRLPLSDMNSRKLHSQTKISKFRKCLWGLYMVTANFEAFDENEVAVRKGEHVSVWNQDDQDWYWIVKHASNCSEEGFVPSSYLREIVSSDSKQASAMEPVVQDKAPHPNRPSSLKHHHPPHQQQEQEFLRPHPPHQQQEREIPRHRPRSGSGSQEMRFASVHRRSSIGSTGGGRRGRLNSDSSLRSSGLKMKTPSATSIEKIDFPESPPTSPPPPYSEVDRSNRRFAQFSLSQQPEVPSGLYSAPMHRSSSHGHTSSNSTYQMRPRMNTHPAMPSSDRRRGTPQDVLHHPPAAGEGGTLV